MPDDQKIEASLPGKGRVQSGRPPTPTLLVFRAASGTPASMTPRPADTNGLSAFNAPQKSMLGKYQVIDISRLKLLHAFCDNPATGHYSIVPRDLDRMQEWIDSRTLLGPPHAFTDELMQAITDTVKV